MHLNAFEAERMLPAAGFLGGFDDHKALALAFEISRLGLVDRRSADCSASSESGVDDSTRRSSQNNSQNTTENVPVPSSEHVAEIVGRQGCKIKALRTKTNTYIKTPLRGEPPQFTVTGRAEDVELAKQEILAAADHFTQIRASRRHSQGGAPAPGQVTIYVPVPYRLVGLVVGPKGATIKRIQQQTHTYIITPSREKDPIFEFACFQITGMPDSCEVAKREIEMHIATRTGSTSSDCSSSDDKENQSVAGDSVFGGEFHWNGSDLPTSQADQSNRTATSQLLEINTNFMGAPMSYVRPTAPMSVTPAGLQQQLYHHNMLTNSNHQAAAAHMLHEFLLKQTSRGALSNHNSLSAAGHLNSPQPKSSGLNPHCDQRLGSDYWFNNGANLGYHASNGNNYNLMAVPPPIQRSVTPTFFQQMNSAIAKLESSRLAAVNNNNNNHQKYGNANAVNNAALGTADPFANSGVPINFYSARGSFDSIYSSLADGVNGESTPQQSSTTPITGLSDHDEGISVSETADSMSGSYDPMGSPLPSFLSSILTQMDDPTLPIGGGPRRQSDVTLLAIGEISPIDVSTAWHAPAQRITSGPLAPIGSGARIESSSIADHPITSVNSNNNSIGAVRLELCSVCNSNSIDSALSPCGHKCFCFTCAHRLVQYPNATCPLCKAAANQVVPLVI